MREESLDNGIGKRIQQKMDELDISQEQLADMSGVSQNTISKLVRGVTKNSRSMAEIALALRVSEPWLRYGDALTAANPQDATIKLFPNVTKTNKGAMVPVISWVAAGAFESVELIPEDELLKWVHCPVPHSDSTFALKVNGISMENPNGKPTFEDGDIIFVDPEKEPENKSCVVVTLEGSSAATFKQLIIETDGKYIQPLNPNWHEKIIKINGNAVINGVVIGRWVDVF